MLPKVRALLRFLGFIYHNHNADALEPLNSSGFELQSIVQQGTITPWYHHTRTALSQSDNYRHSAMGKTIAELITADHQATGTPCATSLPQ